MTDNTALWDKLGKTDPKHTKSFKRAGGFEGTAIKPMWAYRRLTEEFGPCGTGWGIGEPTFQIVPGDNREVLVFCTVSGWYLGPVNQVNKVYGVGGDKVVTHIKANEKYNRPERWENDDEAFKKAFTDAITNAFKLIGVGADVHMGMFDDNKYVNTMRQEFADEPKQEAAKPSSASMKKQLEEIDRELLDCHSILAVDNCAKGWAHIMKRDGWPKDFIECAKPKFQQRRDAINALAASEEPEHQIARQTGGRIVNERITDVSGRELETAEAF